MALRKWFAALALLCCCTLWSDDNPKTFPQWNREESVSEYAQRAKLDAAKSIDLGAGLKLELTLIPAGTFMMGSQQPSAPGNPLLSGSVLLALAAAAGLALLAALAMRVFWGVKSSPYGWLLLLGIAAWGTASWFAERRQFKKYALLKEQFELAAESEKPAHQVELSQPFYMGKYEVTQAQYQAVMNANPSSFKGPARPVENVTWTNAVAFCEKLKTKSGLPLMLPTEAQWEYACRAGTVTACNTGDTLDDKQANVKVMTFDRAKNDVEPETVPVGSYPPNVFGLYDMHGNVWEWCQDFYGEHYYQHSPARDPFGPPQADQGADGRVLRGGSLTGDPDFYRSASRRWLSADDRDNDIGFRIVLPIK